MSLLFWMTFSMNFLCKEKHIINVFLQIKKKKHETRFLEQASLVVTTHLPLKALSSSVKPTQMQKLLCSII